MYEVQADSRESYFAAAAKRETDLRKFDKFVQKAAPGLKPYFHPGTPAGQPGMRVKLLGYGETFYSAADGSPVEWPVIAVALQKNYISVYVFSEVNISEFIGKLGEHKAGRRNNFSFVKFDDLQLNPLEKLLKKAEYIYTKSQKSQT
ncbi:hypothetical protein [Lactovum odontotermitis]